MKISVIVPVYNSEKFLDKCILSIINQTLSDFELILIDDGSRDKSGEICDEWAKKDSRIRVLRQKNGSAAASRNKGLEIAKGDYIAFIDSDDYIDSDYLKAMYEKAEENEADIVLSGCIWEQNGENEKRINPPLVLTKEEYIKAVVGEKIVYITAFGPCCKLYKRKLIKDNNLLFDTRFKLSEDRIFNIKVMGEIKKAVSMEYLGYHYVDNPGSLTHNRKKRSTVKNIIEAENEVWTSFEKMVREAKLYKEYEEYIKKSRTKALLGADAFIVNSENDKSGITKKEMYKESLKVAKNAVLGEGRQGFIWKSLDFTVKKDNVLLLRFWMFLMMTKQKLKSRF